MLNMTSMACDGLLKMGVLLMPQCYRMPELAQVPAAAQQCASENVAGV